MWPRVASKLVMRWIAVVVVASLFALGDGGHLASWFALAPARIWHGEVWRLVTWPLIESGPISLIFACVVIYRCGGELAVRWGDRRLLRFVLQIVLAAGVITTLVATIAGAAYLTRLGGWAITEAIVIAWARQFPAAGMTMYYGLITLRGRALIQATLGTAVLFAIFAGPVVMMPELVACAAAAAYPVAWLRR